MLQHVHGNKMSAKVNAHHVGHKSYLAAAEVHTESWVCSEAAYSGGNREGVGGRGVEVINIFH